MLARQAEWAAAWGEMSVAYKTTKQLCAKKTGRSVPVKDKDGNNLLTESKQALRYVLQSSTALILLLRELQIAHLSSQVNFISTAHLKTQIKLEKKG